ncbi:hypothetical protein R8Z57_17215 [Microbacterium sp. M3]|uniref:Secreted protein n=1 Tax=Microbacterium arthrosphaerae TaxID=792652 RepID=A0ABU4H5B0_9MICO|nr:MULTISPECIES: hypothetical protein [Microbacterium]MDW4574518.1 hypothetical protein [Microbacterium arthrosphaerae]MDW7608373.1 hypothetical protein [Microbacterium sp. M3]
MEPILLIVSTWWWIAPAAAGAGAATYAGLTTRVRRARRLELDAARHEESLAYRALVAAKARVRTAQADVMTSKSQPAHRAYDARRELQVAKQAEKTASLELRASRSRVKAGYSQYRASSAHDPLPIERLYAAHDAVNARWLAYETDVDKALAHPQMTDSRHPATVVFLRAQREALAKRPTLRDRVTPEQYVEYRLAVQDLTAAFDEAERQAGVPGAARAASPGATAAAGISAAAVAIADLADRLPALIARMPLPRNQEPPAGRVP